MTTTAASSRIDRIRYYELYEQGEFQEKRVELIDGVITRRPAPTPKECIALTLVDRALRQQFGHFAVRNQAPLQFNSFTELEPDLAVVSLNYRDYTGIDHPCTAMLVVEVAETTLDRDRTQKSFIYARANITDYWIINLQDNCVEVYREPILDPAAPLGHRYKTLTTLKPHESLSPLANPTAQIPIADLLP